MNVGLGLQYLGRVFPVLYRSSPWFLGRDTIPKHLGRYFLSVVSKNLSCSMTWTPGEGLTLLLSWLCDDICLYCPVITFKRYINVV